MKHIIIPKEYIDRLMPVRIHRREYKIFFWLFSQINPQATTPQSFTAKQIAKALPITITEVEVKRGVKRLRQVGVLPDGIVVK